MAKKTRVKKLNVDFVSLVPAGANPLARVVLAKAAEDLDAEMTEISKCDHGDMAKGEKCSECGYIKKAASKMKKPKEEQPDAGDVDDEGTMEEDDEDDDAAERQANGAPNQGNGGNEQAASEPDEENEGDDGSDSEPAEEKKTPHGHVSDPNGHNAKNGMAKQLLKSVESILADSELSMNDRDALLAETARQFRTAVAKQHNPMENGTMAETKNEVSAEAILKGLTDEQRAAVTKMLEVSVKPALEANEALKKSLDETKAELKKQADELERRDRLAKAKSIVGNAPVKAEAVAEVLKGATKETEAFVTDILAKLNSSMRAGFVMAELGNENGSDSTEPEARLNKAAEEIRKTSPKLTKEQAYAQAVMQNPEIYAELVAEND